MSLGRLVLATAAGCLVACGGRERPQAHGMVVPIRSTVATDPRLGAAILEEVAPGSTEAAIRSPDQQSAYVHLRLSDLERAIATGQYAEARAAVDDVENRFQAHESAVVDLRQRSEVRR